ncbi:carboxypeptidase D-like [Diaphorina citri]|uniref:Carboxypeptidase D-like n=1 Tax=Diaphorina citri TaxID=121845 RepID=A0A3Q0IR11_DIACI|nr:carboxypeptidase D-like [Diaphorina citri]
MANMAALVSCVLLQTALVLLRPAAGMSFGNYHNYDLMREELENFTRVYANMTELYSIGKSVLGKDLLVVNISTAPVHQLGVPNVKIVGNIHGDEPIGREIILRLLEHLVVEYIRGDSNIRFLLDNTRIHLLPNLNPDGSELAVEGNCRSGRGRNNINNHDLNRQFPDYFRHNRSNIPTLVSTSQSIDPEVQAVIDWMNSVPFVMSLQLHGGNVVASYPYDSFYGESKNNINNHDLNRQFPDYFRHNRSNIPTLVSTSQSIDPEVQAVIDWMNSVPFVMSLQLHGGNVVASYPYDSFYGESPNERLIRQYGTDDVEKISKIKVKVTKNKPALTPDTDVFLHLASTYARLHPTMHMKRPCPGNTVLKFENGVTNGAAWYSFSGGMADYNYLYHGCLELTLEISCCRYPAPSEIPIHWRSNQNALISWLQQVHRGVKGLVLDETGSRLANVSISLAYKNVSFMSSQRGEYWRVLMPGIYFIEASKEGYELFRDRIKIPESTSPVVGAVLESLLEFNITMTSIQNDKVGNVSDPTGERVHESDTSTFQVLTQLDSVPNRMKTNTEDSVLSSNGMETSNTSDPISNRIKTNYTSDPVSNSNRLKNGESMHTALPSENYEEERENVESCAHCIAHSFGLVCIVLWFYLFPHTEDQ